MEWKIGEVEIFQIVELECGSIIQNVIPNATPENIKKIAWLQPHFADGEGNLKALVQAFLVKSDNRNILIDTCNGNCKARTDIPEWANLKTEFLTWLVEQGATEKEIDLVVCTHLHMDHVGWNTQLKNGEWVPTFPNAKYLFVKEEYAYWERKPEKEIADDKAAFDDSVTPIVKAGLVEFVSADHKIDKHIRLIQTPGHTPAHVSVLIESQNQRAVISADVLHHPCQIANPDWATGSDTYPDKATESRKKLLSEIADTGTLLLGSHFANPVAGFVKRTDGGFVFRV